MKKRLAGVLLMAALAGCGPRHASFVRVDNVALGRVVIYRNGVAFYERHAFVEGGVLTVVVPRERVDDFLKSLTVVDARTRQALPVSIPRQQSYDSANLVMSLQLPSEDRAEVVLTYVTEAPAWKPSYRVVVGDHDVMLEGWAIVDNTSGEDWNKVVVGVGSSSALSFRYDLWSVRQIQRETLAGEEKFAVAPPSGVAPYAEGAPGGDEVLSELSDAEIRRPPDAAPALSDGELAKLAEQESQAETITVTGALLERRPSTSSARAVGGVRDDDVADVLQALPEPPRSRASAATSTPSPAPVLHAPPVDPRVAAGDQKMQQLAQRLAHSDKLVVIESYAATGDAEATRRATERATAVKNQLIDQGVAAARIQVVAKVGGSERVRLVAQAAATHEPERAAAAARALASDAQPVGESHFASAAPMTVPRGSSAMVSMVRRQTPGEVVYLYDAESERGNARFAFRAVRFKNPTDSTLEAGPVTVYGQERFIGEGLTEPVAPGASAVVPYALDRQIVVERSDGEDDRIQRLASLARGVLTAEVQHVRRQRLKVTNRLGQPARLFLRHTVAKGWSLIDAPPAFERIGDAHLFEVTLAPHEAREIAIAEATPIDRTLDLGADATLEMMKLWIDAPDGAPELKDQLKKLLALHKDLVDLGQAQDSQRRRLADYKARMDDLHRQIVTLQAVKTGGDLLAHLRGKMKEISDRVQRTTIQIVDQEGKIMLARVRFQDAIAELALPDALAAATPGKPVTQAK
jgi:hypothetical protein